MDVSFSAMIVASSIGAAVVTMGIGVITYNRLVRRGLDAYNYSVRCGHILTEQLVKAVHLLNGDLIAKHEKRVTELLAHNNELLERARTAEGQLNHVQSELLAKDQELERALELLRAAEEERDQRRNEIDLLETELTAKKRALEEESAEADRWARAAGACDARAKVPGPAANAG